MLHYCLYAVLYNGIDNRGEGKCQAITIEETEAMMARLSVRYKQINRDYATKRNEYSFVQPPCSLMVFLPPLYN